MSSNQLTKSGIQLTNPNSNIQLTSIFEAFDKIRNLDETKIYNIYNAARNKDYIPLDKEIVYLGFKGLFALSDILALYAIYRDPVDKICMSYSLYETKVLWEYLMYPIKHYKIDIKQLVSERNIMHLIMHVKNWFRPSMARKELSLL